MFRIAFTFFAISVLSACGNDQAAPQAENETAAAAPAAVESVAAQAPTLPALTLPPAGDEETITYDAIDVAKLDNSWWKQYEKGS
jgi:hypothetical protein